MIVGLQGHLLQLVLPVEVKPGASAAQRSATTGNLLLTMPKEDPAATAIDQSCWRSTSTCHDLAKDLLAFLQTVCSEFTWAVFCMATPVLGKLLALLGAYVASHLFKRILQFTCHQRVISSADCTP